MKLGAESKQKDSIRAMSETFSNDSSNIKSPPSNKTSMNINTSWSSTVQDI